MALLKCPDCGKMVSERATSCPDCGCPREYFESEKKEKIPKVTFQLAGHQLDVPGEEYAWYAKVFGDFVNLSYTSVNWVIDLYKDSKNIEKALEKVPTKASEILNATIEFAIKSLYSFGIHITPEEFLEKYYYSHQIDYEQYYNTIVEGYASIMNYQNQLANYRQAQIASRGRWSGGGFGVKGAIKGAISASLMNAGSDFLHSFGDNARKRADTKEIDKILTDYYNLPDTKRVMCDSIGDCILQVYFAMTDELKSQGFLPKDVFCFDQRKAYTMYEHTVKYEENHEKRVENIVQCIMLWPAEKGFYDAIIGEIYANLVNDDEQSNFYAFLRYWGLAAFFEETTSSREQTEKEKEFVNRILSALKGTSLEQNKKNNLVNIPYELLPIEEQKKLIAKVREPFIGNTLIFLSNEYLLTDVLFSDFYHDAIMIADIKKVENEQVGIIDEKGYIFDSGEITFVRNDSTRIVWNKTGSSDGRNLTAMINYGIDAEDAEEEWLVRLANYDFGRGFKSNNIPVDIHTEDDYVKGMKYLASVCAKSGFMLWESAEASLFLSAVMDWKISGKVKEIAWISEELDENSFWNCIGFVRELQKSYLNKAWFFDEPEDKFAPYNNIEKQLMQYGELLLFKNFGVMKPVGFALTEQFLIILDGMAAVKLEDVQEIKIADKSHILIKDENREYLIKVAGTLNMEEDDWNDAAKLQHILNIIILYAIRYGNNHILRFEDKTESKVNKAEETIVAEDFDTYMNALGFTVNSVLTSDVMQAQKVVDAVFGYVRNNNYMKPISSRTPQDYRNNTNIDMLTVLRRWISEIDLIEKNNGFLRDSKMFDVITDSKIFANIPDLDAEEYWKAVRAVAETISDIEFRFLVIDKPNQIKLLKVLEKVNVKPDEVIVHRIIEKTLSMMGFVLTKNMAVDLKKKTKVMLADVIDVIPDRHDYYIDLRTSNTELRLVFFEEDQFPGHITKFVAAALKQYISRLTAKKENSQEVKVLDKPVKCTVNDMGNEKTRNNLDDINETLEKNDMEAKKVKETIFCPYCGKQILRTAKFCNFCGKANNYGKGQ